MILSFRFASLGSTVVRIVSSAGSIATAGETRTAMRGVPVSEGALNMSAPRTATRNKFFISLLPSRRRDLPPLQLLSGLRLQDCSTGCYIVVVNTSPNLCLSSTREVFGERERGKDANTRRVSAS